MTPEEEVADIEAALANGTLAPQPAMQRLVALMRKHGDVPRAKEVYQLASKNAYSGGSSSMSHSHPPPPIEPADVGESAMGPSGEDGES